MLTYLLEANRRYDSAFASFWVTLVSLAVGMVAASVRLLRHSIFSIFLVYNMLGLLFLVGLWGSFHFEYLRQQPLKIRRMAVCPRLLGMPSVDRRRGFCWAH